jgi:hypothetical protein
LAIFLSCNSMSPFIRLETAGSMEFLILVALLRVPRFTKCSNLGNPNPPLFLGV